MEDSISSRNFSKFRMNAFTIAHISHHCHHRRCCTFFKVVYFLASRTHNFGPFLANMRYGLHADMNTLINSGITRYGSLAKRLILVTFLTLFSLSITDSKQKVQRKNGNPKSSRFSFYAKGQRLEGQKTYNLKIKVV